MKHCRMLWLFLLLVEDVIRLRERAHAPASNTVKCFGPFPVFAEISYDRSNECVRSFGTPSNALLPLVVCHWNLRKPCDRQNDQHGRLKGRLLICFFQNFSFSSFSCGVSSNTIHRHISGIQTSILLEICPRGNNKWLLLYFFVHDNFLLFML